MIRSVLCRWRVVVLWGAFELAAALAFPLCLNAQRMSVGVNAADFADYGTMNAEYSCELARHWSATAELKYNPFSYNGAYGTVFSKQRTAFVGARWWPWNVYSGWWMAGKLGWQEYNSGGHGSSLTFEGDRYGFSLSAGYSYMFSTHFNLELGAGLWTGHQTRTTYACQRCGRIVSTGSGPFLLPSELLLAVVYVF